VNRAQAQALRNLTSPLLGPAARVGQPVDQPDDFAGSPGTCQRAFVPVRGGGPTWHGYRAAPVERPANAASSASPAADVDGERAAQAPPIAQARRARAKRLPERPRASRLRCATPDSPLLPACRTLPPPRRGLAARRGGGAAPRTRCGSSTTMPATCRVGSREQARRSFCTAASASSRSGSVTIRRPQASTSAPCTPTYASRCRRKRRCSRLHFRGRRGRRRRGRVVRCAHAGYARAGSGLVLKGHACEPPGQGVRTEKNPYSVRSADACPRLSRRHSSDRPRSTRGRPPPLRPAKWERLQRPLAPAPARVRRRARGRRGGLGLRIVTEPDLELAERGAEAAAGLLAAARPCRSPASWSRIAPGPWCCTSATPSRKPASRRREEFGKLVAAENLELRQRKTTRSEAVPEGRFALARRAWAIGGPAAARSPSTSVPGEADEAAFRGAHRRSAITVHVGPPPRTGTNARWQVPIPASLRLVHWWRRAPPALGAAT